MRGSIFMRLGRISDIVKSSARKWPEQTAVLDCGKACISYRELRESVSESAGELRRGGVRAGEIVGIRAGNGYPFIVAALAAVEAGAIVLPIDNNLSMPETKELMQTTRLAHIVDEDGIKSLDMSSSGEIDIGGDSRMNLISLPTDDSCYLRELLPDAAFIRFTSGTTDAAKGVVLSHRGLLDRMAAANRGLQLGAGDRVLWLLPMAYHFFVSILTYLRYGASIIIPKNSMPEGIVAAANRHRATFMYATPLHYHRLVTCNSDLRFETLRRGVSTSIRLDASVARSFFERYGWSVNQAYGIIEVGLPLMNQETSGESPESVGKPLPDYRAEIRDEDGNTLDKGRLGQLALTGKGMFAAYLSPFRRREEVLEDGMFMTGDMARMNADGSLTIVGRSKSMINVAGKNVFPEEVQAVLDSHPSVVQSRVFGISHPTLGEVVRAELVALDSAESPGESGLISFCRQSLSAFKIPQRIDFVDWIEKTGSGKIRH